MMSRNLNAPTAILIGLMTLGISACTTDDGYDGCHGEGCLVDEPNDVEIDDRPQFDREGNPNFDTEGNYQGCHGLGCEVDDPDDPS